MTDNAFRNSLIIDVVYMLIKANDMSGARIMLESMRNAPESRLLLALQMRLCQDVTELLKLQALFDKAHANDEWYTRVILDKMPLIIAPLPSRKHKAVLPEQVLKKPRKHKVKNYDSAHVPDPERWLPHRLRKNYEPPSAESSLKKQRGSADELNDTKGKRSKSKKKGKK